MNDPKKNVVIHLKTVIQEQTDKEQNEVKAAGVFLQKGKLHVLSYNEKIDDAEITTLITIQEGRVSIKRSGAVSMHQQFRLGQRTENVYKHPHGNFHMETYTNNMYYFTLETGKKAKLELDYTVKLNGQIERKHRLELTFKEDPQ